jgi:two-component system nitrogen regulation response regulator NtrX
VVTATDINRLLPAADGGVAASAIAARTFEAFRLEVERAFFRRHLEEHDWNVTDTARALQMPRTTLHKRIERLGLIREGT